MSGEILERNVVNHRNSWFQKSGNGMQKIRGLETAQSPSSFLLPLTPLSPPPLGLRNKSFIPLLFTVFHPYICLPLFVPHSPFLTFLLHPPSPPACAPTLLPSPSLTPPSPLALILPDDHFKAREPQLQ
jgi:hypothetical protein